MPQFEKKCETWYEGAYTPGEPVKYNGTEYARIAEVIPSVERRGLIAIRIAGKAHVVSPAWLTKTRRFADSMV